MPSPKNNISEPHIDYTSSGVNYDWIDPFKILAQKWGRKTSNKRTQTKTLEIEVSRGESAFVWEEKDCYRATVIEGLGTKNLVADAMRSITGKSYYGAIAQDTVAMIVNDLITVGATPQVINAYFAVGDSRWFADRERAKDLLEGWANTCIMAGAVWGGGETPVIKGIIAPGTIDLAGSAVGIIKPKNHLLLGDRIAIGDAIVLVESSGIHANGLTLARAVADNIPKGYASKLPDGSMYGEALLSPTHIYAGLVDALFIAGVPLHYLVNITGHGWRKLMRAKRNVTYMIEWVPKTSSLFDFIAEHANLTDQEMYATFNMGAGFAIYVPERDVDRVIAVAKRLKLHAWQAGHIESGKRQVIIKPKRIVYTADTLKIRN